MTDELRSRRPIFIATLWAGASWLFFRVARSTRMTQIWVLRSPLEKQPTDLRQSTGYFGDRTRGTASRLLNERFRWRATLSRFLLWKCGVSIIGDNLRVITTPGVARKFSQRLRMQILGMWRVTDQTPSPPRQRKFSALYSKPIAKPFSCPTAPRQIAWPSGVFVRGTTVFCATAIPTSNPMNAMLPDS